MTTNRITGLRAFLRAWEAPPRTVAKLPLKKGECGNVNLDGRNGSPAVTFTRHHPQFVNSLEEGVKELVLLLVDQFGCITYSSCAGHEAQDGQILRERNVDIVPRDESEYRRLRSILQRAVSDLRVESDSVRVRLNETVLESDDIDMDCLDIQFAAITPVANSYFSDLDMVYQAFLSSLRRLAEQEET